LLAEVGLESRIDVISTEGDDTATSLTSPAAPGVFVSGLRRALLAGEVDFIVHSCKDLPSGPAAGIELAALLRRGDHRDVLVSRDRLTLRELAPGAVVGTSSPRRAARMRFLRPDLEVRPIRGNVDSRLAALRQGSFDALVLAAAGLDRLGRLVEATHYFELDDLVPAPGQGCLAVECRTGDLFALERVARLDDAETRTCVLAERAILAALSASCATAVGAYARVADQRLEVVAELSDPNGRRHERFVDSCRLGNDPVRSAVELGGSIGRRLKESDLGRTLAG